MSDADRLRAVEEAVIEFRHIANTIVVDHKQRLEKLEAHDKDFQEAVNTSCTMKDKQIAEGDSKTFWRCAGLIGALFLLFIGAVVYFNNMDGKIFDRINRDYEDTVKVKTLTNTILSRFDKIEDKLDLMVTHKHDNSDFIKRVEKIENYQNRNYGFLQGLKGKE